MCGVRDKCVSSVYKGVSSVCQMYLVCHVCIECVSNVCRVRQVCVEFV